MNEAILNPLDWWYLDRFCMRSLEYMNFILQLVYFVLTFRKVSTFKPF